MNYWILQSNPAKFRILDWLRNYSDQIDSWHIGQFKKGEVKPGDIAFIWKAKGNSNVRGIYAKAMVTPTPEKFPLWDIAKSYWIDKAERERMAKLKLIAIKYTALYLDKPLLSDDIEKIPELKGLTILRAHRQGIHKVRPEQGRIIESMMG